VSKKWWIVIGVVVVIAGLGFGGWQFISSRRDMIAEAQASTETAVVRRDTLAVTVEGTGSLAPRGEVALAFLSGGQVAELLVEEGQVVEAGQPLARLETDELALQVARSEAALASAEGQLAQLLAPPQPEEVAAQEANLAAAQGQVSAAVANRDQVTAGPSEAEIASAETQVATAQQQHRTALINYDTIETEVIIEGVKKTNEQARYDLWAAEIAVEAAQTQLNVLLAGASADEVRAAQANVASAVAQRDAAQAQLDLLLAGATEEQVQAAEAAVDQARVALDQARLLLEQATLTASMGGTVTAVDIGIGEMLNPGQPVVVLSDLTALEVDVNLDETDVARVAVGQEARVSVDAFPGVEMAGEVTYIAPVAETQSGVVLYPVTICLTPSELPVRAGMTADVKITTASQENALIVPLRAVHTEGEHAYVDRLAGGQIEQVEVELGMTTETEAEITSGLAEGDVVIVVAGATSDSDRRMPGPMGPFSGGH
jgi:HlyD family secretion protein